MSEPGMNARYWLVLPNGSQQLIDPTRFDLAAMAVRARRLGGSLVAEVPGETADRRLVLPDAAVRQAFEPPIQAVGPLFRNRLEQIFNCRVEFSLDIATRATSRVLGGYYRRRRLVRVYSHDRETGRRPLEELFATVLHEVAHHLEYTEPSSFQARACQRKRGQMHSPLFWRILSELKQRWEKSQRGQSFSLQIEVEETEFFESEALDPTDEPASLFPPEGDPV